MAARNPRKPAAKTADSSEIKTTPTSDIPPQQRTDLDVGYFRNRIFEELHRLEEEREYLRQGSGDMDGNLPEDAEAEEDTADLASSLMDQEMNMSLEEQIEDTMSSIERALQKIDEGTYGICDVSGAPIPLSRLEYLPWSCLTAQMQSIADENSGG